MSKQKKRNVEAIYALSPMQQGMLFHSLYDPEESLYVGDVYSVDYLGATGAGMQAMLFDVAGAYGEKGVPRVESLQELGGILSA